MVDESVTLEHLLGEIKGIKKKLTNIEYLLMALIEDAMITEEELSEIRKTNEIIDKKEFSKIIRVA